MYRMLFIINVLLCLATPSSVVGAEHEPEKAVVLPDSSNFIKASLVSIGPGKDLYSALGHSLVHMECPSQHIDYCYTFEIQPSFGNALLFLVGQSKAMFVCYETGDLLDVYKKEGRSICQYELNLTHHEKQELWRSLDEDIISENKRKFNFVLQNCTSEVLLKIVSIMFDEKIEYKWAEEMSMNNRDYVAYMYRERSWMEFFYVTFFTGLLYTDLDKEYCTTPYLLGKTFEQSAIRNNADGSLRKLVKNTEILNEQTQPITQSNAIPTVVFLIIFIVIVMVTLGERKFGWRLLPAICDIAIITAYVILATAITATMLTKVFSTSWNWFFIIINPIPILIWCLFRKRLFYYRMYILYAIILIAFAAIFPLITKHWELPHMFISLSLATRCYAKYLTKRI